MKGLKLIRKGETVAAREVDGEAVEPLFTCWLRPR
jgi:hypothetical protein